MNKHKLITIVGNVGSGKTTAMPIVAKALKATMLHADNLFQTSNPFREMYLENISRWAFTNELWMTIERINLLKKHLKRLPNQITIIDSGLLMSWVYTYSHLLDRTISQHEWDLYEKIYRQFTNNFFQGSHVIYLNYSTNTLLSRIKKRGRDYELKYYTKNYLQKLDKGLVALKKELKKSKIRIHIISEKHINDFEKSREDRIKLIRKIKTFPFTS